MFCIRLKLLQSLLLFNLTLFISFPLLNNVPGTLFSLLDALISPLLLPLKLQDTVAQHSCILLHLFPALKLFKRITASNTSSCYTSRRHSSLHEAVKASFLHRWPSCTSGTARASAYGKDWL